MSKQSVYRCEEMMRFLNSYLREEQLNQYIKEVIDISLLRTALEIKLNLITQGKHNLISFPIKTILNESSTLKIDDFCSILKTALSIQQDDVQYKLYLDYLCNKKINVLDETSVTELLKLLEVGLNLCDTEKRRCLFNEFVITSHFDNYIWKFLNVESKTIRNYICTCILPNYVKYNVYNISYILDNIWKTAQKPKDLNVLCILPQLFLPLNTGNLIKTDQFWICLQECLVDNNDVVRKQARFLLNQAINEIKIEKEFTTENKIISWDAECKEKIQIALQNLCIILDVIREKQLHLIVPSYGLLPSIGLLHYSWFVCVYKLLLLHSHSAVSGFAVCEIFKVVWNADFQFFKSIIKQVLPILNRIEYTEHKAIWNEFSVFCKKLNTEHIIIMLEECINIKWIPSICYQFYNYLFSSSCIDISNTFLNIIEKLLDGYERLPHKFIRNGCYDIVAMYLAKRLDYGCEFNTYKRSIKIFKKSRMYGSQKLSNSFLQCSLNSEQILTRLCNTNEDFEEIDMILEIIRTSKNLHENLFQLLINKKFPTITTNKVCIFLYNYEQYRKFLFPYIIGRFETIQNSDRTVIELIKLPILFGDDQIEIDNINEKCMTLFLDESNNTFKTEIAFEIMNTLLRCNKCNFKTLQKIDFVITTWKTKILAEARNINVKTCRVFLELYCNRYLFKHESLNNSENLEIIVVFEKVLDTQSNIVVPLIFKNLKYLLNIYNITDDVLHFIDLCIKKLLEIRRTDQFQNAIENFIESMFCNSKIFNRNSLIVNKCIEIVGNILEIAKTSDSTAYSLAKCLRLLLNSNPEMIHDFDFVIIDLLLFGEVLRKDQRAEYIVCQQIACENTEYNEENPNFLRLSIRGQTILILKDVLKLLSEVDKTIAADKITLLLIEKYKVDYNKRYYANSKLHLQKLRILQALLIVYSYIKQEKDVLVQLLIDSLCTESHQVSIKFLIQWLLIKLLRDNDRSLFIIKSTIESTSKAHSSTIIAFIPILYHIALSKNDEKFWIDLLEAMLPWTMGAHFNLRLYAQEGILKLYAIARKRNFLLVEQKFKVTIDCINEVLNKSERKISIVDEYVFNNFDANIDYFLLMIYYYIPKLTNVTFDEYENFMYIPEFVKEPNGKTTSIITFLETNDSTIITKQMDTDLCTDIIQKKITPQMESYHDRKVENINGNLIVVASLIDKMPNLGGLSRTCEIFNVRQLIVSSLSIVKNREFQSVSMSSENWVDISEIKVDNLPAYLLEMKQQGYKIVAAEQTSDSTTLNKFEFPKDCLLLLGNEKEGIPPNLLAMIDFCIEIPQFGVVRSLNVHVAAAMFIWEYVKKHVV